MATKKGYIVKIPFTSKTQKVQESWIDYNGHMNVGYYTFAFNKAIDEFLDLSLDVGPKFVKKSGQGSYALQSQYRYLSELIIDTEFNISIFIADFTAKRMHLMLEMKSINGSLRFATCETILVNVDLKKRKSCEYPKRAKIKMERLYKASESIRSQTQLGHPIGLKK